MKNNCYFSFCYILIFLFIISFFFFFFFFNDTATTEIYTLLYIFPYTTLFRSAVPTADAGPARLRPCRRGPAAQSSDNCPVRSEEHTSELQSHSNISYAVFC